MADKNLEYTRTKAQSTADEFPSNNLLITLYTCASALSLLFALDENFDALRTTNCLILSWFCAIIALGIGIFSASGKEEED